MESDECLQEVLGFIATGLQNIQNCSAQLLLLLVLLEEVYEAKGSIPLLTEKRSTIQKIIGVNVGEILNSVCLIFRQSSACVFILLG